MKGNNSLPKKEDLEKAKQEIVELASQFALDLEEIKREMIRKHGKK